MAPLVLVMGTDGRKAASPWWRPSSPFAALVKGHGLVLLDEREPFDWGGMLGGTAASPPCDPDDPWCDHRELVVWSAAGKALKWYLDARAPGPVDLIGHSHGGAVIVYALLYAQHQADLGAPSPWQARRVITVSTPVRADMKAHRLAALKAIADRWLHFYDRLDGVQEHGCLGDGGYPLDFTRTWPEPALSVEVPGNSHSRMLNEDPAMFVQAGGVSFLLG